MWKSYKGFITFGSLIILIGYYFSPVIKESKYKNSCIKFSTKGALIKFNEDKIRIKAILEETGLKIEELAKIEGFKNCA